MEPIEKERFSIKIVIKGDARISQKRCHDLI